MREKVLKNTISSSLSEHIQQTTTTKTHKKKLQNKNRSKAYNNETYKRQTLDDASNAVDASFFLSQSAANAIRTKKTKREANLGGKKMIELFEI